MKFQIIRDILEECMKAGCSQLDYNDAEIHFLIRNVGPAFLGNKVIYSAEYSNQPARLKYEIAGCYIDGVLYNRTYRTLLSCTDKKYGIEGTEEEAYAEFKGRFKSYASLYEKLESEILEKIRDMVNAYPIPTDLSSYPGVEDMADTIAWNYALLGKIEPICNTLKYYDLDQDIADNIIFSVDDDSTTKEAKLFYNKNSTELVRERLALLRAEEIKERYINDKTVKLYNILGSTQAVTVKCAIEGDGKIMEFKLNKDSLMDSIAEKSYLGWGAYATNKEHDEACEQVSNNKGSYRRGDVFPSQIIKITYGKKVIYDEKAA